MIRANACVLQILRFAVLLVGCWLWGRGMAEDLTEAPGPSVKGKELAKPTVVRIAFRKPSYSSSEPIPYWVAVENWHYVDFNASAVRLLHSLEIMHDGRLVEETAGGGLCSTGSLRGRRKEQGCSRIGFEIEDLRQLYDVTKDGCYVVRLVIEGPAGMLISDAQQMEVRTPLGQAAVALPAMWSADEVSQVPEAEWGACVEGLRLCARPTKRVFDDGDQIGCELILANVGQKTRSVGLTNLLASNLRLHLAAILADGQTREWIAETALGIRLLHLKAKDDSLPTDIRPGQAIYLKIRDLGRLYDMSCYRNFEFLVTATLPADSNGEHVDVSATVCRITFGPRLGYPSLRPLSKQEVDSMYRQPEEAKK